MNIYEKHAAIVQELKAPKSKRNNFAGFDYRNVSGIIEQVKPLLEKYKCTIHMNDTVKQIGDRFYVEAFARLQDCEDVKGCIDASALAREQAEKKGMDAAQLTGATSSYARKYALCGLLLIDDSELEPTHDIDGESGRPEGTTTPPATRTTSSTTGAQARTTSVAKNNGQAQAQDPVKAAAKEAWNLFQTLESVKSVTTKDAKLKLFGATLKQVCGKDRPELLTVEEWLKITNHIQVVKAA